MNQTCVINLYLWTTVIVFNCSIESLLSNDHLVCFSCKGFCSFRDQSRLLSLARLNFRYVGFHLFFLLSRLFLLFLHFLLYLTLSFHIFTSFELCCLTTNFTSMLLLLLIFDHCTLLDSKLLLSFDLLNDFHFARILISTLLQVCMLFGSDSVRFHELEISLKFLTLFFDLRLNHLDSLIFKLLFFSIPVP